MTIRTLIVFSLAALQPAPVLLPVTLTVDRLRVEYLTNPIGIDAVQPRLSWRIASTRRNTIQAAYQLQVGMSEASLTRGANLLWDSGKIASDASVFVDYAGPPARSGTRYYWRVRVWDTSGAASPWSAIAFWETGLLQPGDWTAQWIGPQPTSADSLPSPSPLLRRAFRVDDRVRAARLYITSLGLYEVYLNGQRVGDALFTPGWTSYHRRLQYQTYDVTALLRPGDNAVGAMLGDGWYRGHLGFFGQRNLYGRRLALRAQLEIRYESGRTERVGSDTGWKTTVGPVLASDIYGGETYDARREIGGWAGAPYDDRAWAAVALVEPPPSALVASLSPPVRRVRVLRPVDIRRAPSGETVFDLGQNFTGWARLSVRGPAGTTVTLRFSEVLDRDGNLYTANLRAAAQTDHYTLSGNGREVYEPHFTFHGFRYVAARGLPAPPDSATITGIALSSDLAQTGSLVTSDSLLNQLQRNIVWGQRSNFLDVPTDCPQRDERLGWTGDAQVFARTAAFNMDVAGFFAKWLSDVAADQDPSGSVPWVIPNPLGGDSVRFAGTAGWSDVAVIVPWTMYLTYGDRRLLERQYPSMRAWVDYARRRAGTDLIWRPGWQFGDWLALHSDDPSYPGATTGTDLIATAFLAHSTDLVSRTATALGRDEEAAEYRARFRAIREAFDREFVSRTGRVGENTQTAYVLAIAFDLLPDSLVPTAAGRLAQDAAAREHHLTTGFLGTPYLLHVLGATGHIGEAFALLTQRTYPSWLYPITRGATTMWERWDGIRPDSSFQDPGMNSFNHYAFGAVGDWMYQNIGGIDVDPAGPGYRQSRIAPRPGAGLTSASASLETAYGTVRSAWRLEEQRFVLEVTVPANTSAEVTLWDARLDQVREGDVSLTASAGVRAARQRGRDVVVDVGSGRYRFAVLAQNEFDATGAYLDRLIAGDSASLLAGFAGEPAIDDPIAGPVRNRADLDRFVAERHRWLAEREARLEPLRTTRDVHRTVVEAVLHLRLPDTAVALPIAVVGDRAAGALVRRIRVYHSHWPLEGEHRLRPPLLAPDSMLELRDVIGAYQRALAAGDVAAIVSTFEPDGSFREPSGGVYVHRGRDQLRAFMTIILGGGGIRLEHCTVTDDGVVAAIEFNAVQFGPHRLQPQAGLAVYERGPSGLLHAARIYDDVNVEALSGTGTPPPD